MTWTASRRCVQAEEKEASYSADVDRLASLHLKEVDLKDAALREKDEALVQKQTQLAKALESGVTLQEEVARLTHASKVREREVLEVSHETDSAFHRGSFFLLLCLVFLAIFSFCCALRSLPQDPDRGRHRRRGVP